MKVLLFGLVLILNSAHAQFDMGPNGPTIACMTERVKDGIAGFKLCLKVQLEVMDKRNPDSQIKAFNEIMTSAIADLPSKGKKQGTTARDAITRMIQDTKKALNGAVETYVQHVKTKVATNSKVISLHSACSSEGRVKRVRTNSCTNYAQKVSSVLQKSMSEKEWGQGVPKKISGDFLDVINTFDIVFKLDKRFSYLHDLIDAERWNIDRLHDEVSGKIEIANQPFHSFMSRYGSNIVDFVHRNSVLDEVKALGIEI